jgi:hypothetical protein
VTLVADQRPIAVFSAGLVVRRTTCQGFMVIRELVIAALGLGGAVLASPARAQSFPGPVMPPLPLPPLLPSEFAVAQHPSDAGASAKLAISPAASAKSDALMRMSSEAQREAFGRSQFHESWYGWQTLTVDATAVGILLLGAAVLTTPAPVRTLGATPESRPVAFEAASLGVYALAPSVVHFMHGSVWKGLESIALRVVLPLVGIAVGYLAGAARSSEGGASQGPVLGGLSGVVGAMAADAALLGWDRWQAAAAAPSTSLFSTQASF